MGDGNGWLVWVGVALALGAVEAATVDLVFIMLAGGALGGAVASAFGAGFAIQVVVAVVVSGMLLGVVRPLAKKRLTSAPHAPMGVKGYAGRPATVIEEVTDHSGRVSIGGETWTARALDHQVARPGDQVTVLRIEGATAVVETAPASPQDEVLPPPGT